MMQMNYEGGNKEKNNKDSGDVSEEYDYGQEL